MAIWHTDNLLGNDSTGDGSSSLPYKSIKQAVNVASDGDTIKVAGSGFTSLGVDAVIGSSISTTVTTSSSLVGILSPGDIITIDDTTFTGNVQLFKVFSVSASNIVLNCAVPYKNGGSFNIKKLDTVHYYTTTTNTVFETGWTGFGDIDNIQILCGWVDGYTAQTGITAMVYHHPSNALSTSGTGIRDLKGTNFLIDRIAFISLAYSFQACNETTAYIGTTWTSNISHIGSIFDFSKTGVSKAILDPGVGLRKNVYINAGTQTANSADFKDINETIYLNDIYYQNNKLSSTEPCFKTVVNNIYSYLISGTRSFQLYGDIGKINVSMRDYAFYDTFFLFSSSPSASSIVRDIEYFDTTTPGPFSVGLYADGESNYFVVFDIPTKNIDDYLYYSGSNTIDSNFAKSNLFYGTAIANDIEGQKRLVGRAAPIFVDNTVYDTGTNSLRMRLSVPFPQGPIKVKDFVGSGSSQTITIRLKASASVYGSRLCIINLFDPTISYISDVIGSFATDWTDYTITYLETEENYLAFEGHNLGVAIQQPYPGPGGDYIWVDSVTIS